MKAFLAPKVTKSVLEEWVIPKSLSKFDFLNYVKSDFLELAKSDILSLVKSYILNLVKFIIVERFWILSSIVALLSIFSIS